MHGVTKGRKALSEYPNLVHLAFATSPGVLLPIYYCYCRTSLEYAIIYTIMRDRIGIIHR